MSRAITITASALALMRDAYGLQALRGVANSNVDPQGNVCMEGRFAPEFFLLGVPKGGTTYFYEDFVRSDGLVDYTPLGEEEDWHKKEAWVFAPYERELREKDYWLKHFPECQQETRKVAIDGTPGYFGCETAPKTIYKFYDGSGHIQNLKFMVFLRNPVTRTHSHYYQYVENGVFDGAFGDGCSADVYPKTFAEAVQRVLETDKMCEGCACNDVFQDSMYASSFQNYFKYFNASQFTVVPFQVAVKPELVTFTWDMLGMPHGTGSKESLASEESGGETNHHEYPTLEEDLEGPIRASFVTYIEDKAGANVVASVLAKSGAHLWSFEGNSDDESAIKNWLSCSWGA